MASVRSGRRPSDTFLFFVVQRTGACDDRPEPESEGAARSTPTASDTIEIEVGDNCRVRVGPSFDGRALKRVLDVLSRAEGERKKIR